MSLDARNQKIQDVDTVSYWLGARKPRDVTRTYVSGLGLSLRAVTVAYIIRACDLLNLDGLLVAS